MSAIPAITLWQPWATLVAEGVKPFEFRRWSAPAWVWGKRIAIHAGARPVRRADVEELLTSLRLEEGWGTTLDGFANRFGAWCDQAGLPARCTAHGLRKATGARLAERGATAHEIMAVLGHSTLAQAENYTRAARRGALADSAMAKLGNGHSPNRTVPLSMAVSDGGNIRDEKAS